MASALVMKSTTYDWETADSLGNMKERASHLLLFMPTESK